VDEDHPTVQELVEAGYNVEQSIEAVEHSEKPEKALDYLLRFGGEEGIFQASTSVLAEGKHQYREEREAEFMEVSQQERVLYIFHLYCPSLSLTANASKRCHHYLLVGLFPCDINRRVLQLDCNNSYVSLKLAHFP